jgi:Na+-translocating ferredoxin:NAD+ oxidoreductase subunit C
MEQIFVFPLKQNIGFQAIPVVEKGDLVKRGQRIAMAPPDTLGVNVFTSVCGSVANVSSEDIQIIADKQQTTDYITLTSKKPLDLIRESGLVGLGGAGFPTYAKLTVPFKGDGTVIVNASECEPVLNHNIDAIEHDAHRLIRGLEIVMDIVQATQGIIAIKEIHSKAIDNIKRAIENSDIKICLLPNIYPVGEERAIVREVMGRLLDVDQLPMTANAIVINSESICRVQEAVDDKKPFIDKDITVAGKINGELIQVFHDIPLGISVDEMFKKAGGLKDGYGEIIMGGPFTGKRVQLHDPIIKTTGGIIATEAFLKGPDKIGLLVCACGGDQARLEQMAASMGSQVADIEFCKQAKLVKNGVRKCENPGKCPGQVQKVMALKKAGAQALLISNCSDCTNTVMSCAPQLKLPVYHCTDGALRAVNHKLIRKMKSQE